jgi:hypothetical protein
VPDAIEKNPLQLAQYCFLIVGQPFDDLFDIKIIAAWQPPTSTNGVCQQF